MKLFLCVLLIISFGFSQDYEKNDNFVNPKMIKNEPTITININGIGVTWELTNTDEPLYNSDLIFEIDTLICKSFENDGYTFVDKNECPLYTKAYSIDVVRSYENDSLLIEFGYNKTLRVIWFRKYSKKHS